MILTTPFNISSRLLPAVQIKDGTIQLEYSKRPGREGRIRYKWTIDIPAGSFSDDDLQSGCGGGNLQDGFVSLLCFLGSAAESFAYKGEQGENADLFPRPVVEWAYQHSDEIEMLRFDIEESGQTFIEE